MIQRKVNERETQRDIDIYIGTETPPRLREREAWRQGTGLKKNTEHAKITTSTTGIETMI